MDNVGEIEVREATPFQLAQDLLQLNGERFDLTDYPYLKAVYNTRASRVGLFTGRQVAKSTTLASKLVLNAVCHPGCVQVFVAPLQEQAMVFAQQRLRDFISGSPIIQDGFFDGPGKIDQVLRRVFNAGSSMITLGYAQRTADRLRGQSVKDGKMHKLIDPNTGELIEVGGAQLTFDEIQDIMPEIYPVVEEMAFRAKSPRFWYCGTPKSLNNPMEGMRNRSTGAEWAVRCQAMGCKKWNHSWTEKNIGDHGVICEFCGAALNTNADGRWVVARKMDLHLGRAAKVTMETYRVPQLIVKPVMDRKSKWLELLEKLRTYSTEKFRNEVLGLPHDSGSVPVTIEQLHACCDPDRENLVPNPHKRRYPPLVMGVDWAFNGENSYTFVTIGGYNPYPGRYDVYYWKIFKGIETDPLYQIDWMIKAANYAGIQLLGCDWGAGQVQNLQLINALGEERVIQMWHTGMTGSGAARAARAKWEPKTRKWHLARTRVLTDVFEMIRTRQISFPRSAECQELFDHFMAVSLEYNDKTNTQRYVNVRPDDGLHSTCYGTIAAEFLVRGDFKGHMGSTVTSEGASPDIWNEQPNAGTDSLYR